ncbi:hypothetical protein DVH24_036229 [Malus domestica]|uniref:Uncharacterized protein n=1 Tax=Malus domestica TaxID=3750 RepID=A0A498IE23_MALDO|nr:hypothetical protein DVH24_036229 [Malus domestica]
MHIWGFLLCGLQLRSINDSNLKACSDCGGILFDQLGFGYIIINVTSRPRADHFRGPLHHRSTILSALGPDHALTVLFLRTHKQLPSGSSILGVLWPPSLLISEFL